MGAILVEWDARVIKRFPHDVSTLISNRRTDPSTDRTVLFAEHRQGLSAFFEQAPPLLRRRPFRREFVALMLGKYTSRLLYQGEDFNHE